MAKAKTFKTQCGGLVRVKWGDIVYSLPFCWLACLSFQLCTNLVLTWNVSMAVGGHHIKCMKVTERQTSNGGQKKPLLSKKKYHKQKWNMHMETHGKCLVWYGKGQSVIDIYLVYWSHLMNVRIIQMLEYEVSNAVNEQTHLLFSLLRKRDWRLCNIRIVLWVSEIPLW